MLDVFQNQMRTAPKKTSIRLITIVVVAFAVLVGAIISGNPTAESAKFATVSSEGQRVQAPRRHVSRLHSLGYREVYLLETIDDRALYRVIKSDGRVCYGAGFAASIGSLGRITCMRQELPLMDFSVMEITRGSDEIRPYRVEGIAADGIATVAITDSTGKILARTDVLRNVYHFRSVPNMRVDGLVGLDVSGNRVGELHFGKP
jgi:hypothetical protein